MNELPEVLQSFNCFIFAWNKVGYVISIDQVREDRDGGFHAELWVERVEPRTGKKVATLYQDSLNLYSDQKRSKAARKLTEKYNGLDWEAAIHFACLSAADKYRHTEPALELDQMIAPKETQYLLDKLCPLNDTSIFYGDKASCKSWIGLAACVAVETGETIANIIRPQTTGPALYIDYETNASAMYRRLLMLSGGLGIPIPKIHYLQPHRRFVDDLPSIRREYMRIMPAMMLVDSLALAVGGDINEAKEASPFLEALRTFDCTRIVIGQISKADQASKSTGKIIGSTLYDYLGRSNWQIRADDSANPNVSMLLTKTNYRWWRDPLGMRLSFDDEKNTCLFTEIDVLKVPALAQSTSVSYRIRKVLGQRGQMTIEDIASTIDALPDTVKKSLRRMTDVNNSRLGRKGEPGLWSLITQKDMRGHLSP